MEGALEAPLQFLLQVSTNLDIGTFEPIYIFILFCTNIMPLPYETISEARSK